MKWLAILAFSILAVIAALHAAWSAGSRWPAGNERDLVALVIGAAGRKRMPGTVQCIVATAMIFFAGVIALLVGRVLIVPPIAPSVVVALGLLACAIFAGRGLAAYVPGWRKVFSQQPFARYDQIAYGPLCLGLAVAFALLTVNFLRNPSS